MITRIFTDNKSMSFAVRCLAIGISVVAILLLLFIPQSPYVYNLSSVRDSNYSWMLRISSALCAPLVVECTLDYLFTPTADAQKYEKSRLLLQFKTLLVCEYFIPDIISATVDKQTVRQSMYMLQSALTTYTWILILAFHDPEIWTYRLVTHLMINVGVIFVFASVYILTGLEIIIILLVVLAAIILPFLLVNLAKWLWKHRGLIRRVWFSVAKLAPGEVTNEEMIPVFYVLVMLGYAVLLWTLPIMRMLGVPEGSRFMVIYVAKFIVLGLFVLIPNRLEKLNAVQSDFELENQKSFVQYISHETRGPLQVANMGLELYLENLVDFEQKITNAINGDVGGGPSSCIGNDISSSALSTIDLKKEKRVFLKQCITQIADIADACTLAQETLSDMLTLEKIETGMLALDKTVFPVLEFISSEFRSFFIQARYKKIDMVFDWKASLNPLYEHMTINADKRKISQVLRNLLSNSLKFTPSHGTITCIVSVMKRCAKDPNTTSFNNDARRSHASQISYDRDSTGKADASSTVIDMPAVAKFARNGSKETVLDSASRQPTASARVGSGLLSGVSSVVVSPRDRNSVGCGTPREVVAPSVIRQMSHSTPRCPSPGITTGGGTSFILRGRVSNSNSIGGDSTDATAGMNTNTTVLEDISQAAVRDLVADPKAIENLICRIEIHDTGVGISKKNIRKLFGKYVQFDPAKIQQGGGSGLGLWLSRSIVEHHGGNIGVRSSGFPGEGCVFYVDLPLHSVLPEENEKESVNTTADPNVLDIGHVNRLAVLKSTDIPVDHSSNNNPMSPVGMSKPLPGFLSVRSRGSSEAELLQEQNMLKFVTIQGNALLSAYEHNYSKTGHGRVSGSRPNLSVMPSRAPSLMCTPRNRSFSATPRAGVQVTPEFAPSEPIDLDEVTEKLRSSSHVMLAPIRKHIDGINGTVDMSDVNEGNSFSKEKEDSTTKRMIKLSNSKDILGSSSSFISTPSYSRTRQQIGGRSTMNVLVVDDMASNRKVLKRLIMMLKLNINCFELADGSDAVDVISKSLMTRPDPTACTSDRGEGNDSASTSMYYDMIFMDSQMTKMDGPVATEIIKSKLKYEGLIYGVTGDVNSTERFLNAGAMEVIIKPMKKEKIEEIISDYWTKHNLTM